MVTSPYEWKILERDENLQANKQTKQNCITSSIVKEIIIFDQENMYQKKQLECFCISHNWIQPRRWCSGLERSPLKRKVWCSIPAATDLSCKNRYWQLHCYTPSVRCECHGSSEMTILNGCPESQGCGTLKNPFCAMAISAEYRSKWKPFTDNGGIHMSETSLSGT